MLSAQIIADYNNILTVAFIFDNEVWHIVAGEADDMMELLEYVFAD